VRLISGLRVQDSIYGVITGGSLWEARGAPYGRHGGHGELPLGWFESAGQYIWCDNGGLPMGGTGGSLWEARGARGAPYGIV